MPPEQQTSLSNQIPVNPTPQVGYAGFWLRFLALNLDSLIVSIIITLPINIIAEIVGGSTGFKGMLVLLQTVLIYTYFIYLTNKNQATIGKKLLGLRVVSEDGSQMSLGKIILRETIGKFISFIILLGIGYLMVAFTAKKQGLHDKMVGSVVLSNRAERKTWAFVLSIIMSAAIPLLILGILASVVLVSLNSARTKQADVTVKTSISNIRAQAVLIFDSNMYSYETVCTNPNIIQYMTLAENAVMVKGVCNASKTAYAAYAPLKFSTQPNTGWCVDSTGIAKESREIGTSTICP